MMRDDTLSPHDLALLRALVEAEYAADVRAQVLQEADDLAGLVNYALSHDQHTAAFDLAAKLTPEQLIRVLPHLLVFASHANPYMNAAEDLIFTLPPHWLRENIATYAQPILQSPNVEAEEFDRIIAMYERLDPAMALGLARWALQQADEDINDMGRTWLQQHKPNR